MRFVNFVNKRSTVEYLVDDLDNPSKLIRDEDDSDYYRRIKGEKTISEEFIEKYGENRLKNKVPVFEMDIVFTRVYKGNNRSGFYVKDVESGKEWEMRVEDVLYLLKEVPASTCIKGMHGTPVFRFNAFPRNAGGRIFLAPFTSQIVPKDRTPDFQMF